MLLVVCQLSRDVIGYEDSKCHWCVSIRLLSQLESFKTALKKYLLVAAVDAYKTHRKEKPTCTCGAH